MCVPKLAAVLDCCSMTQPRARVNPYAQQGERWACGAAAQAAAARMSVSPCAAQRHPASLRMLLKRVCGVL